ncbi:Bug family tripartite tricarboxylate transporter substrate binding protein [Variovorax sp. PAMC26660]|uniref:Bug family tripartite tricarboxylate transporter substrate binding protein n=1 Tax=Variovorax sp. PAMC26660 TaxID=2762322 RepID=UPI00164E50D2|nr:tripartite tricarboxylate transporter substrate binding protein [Variovorax sp. PAMC26660]QNK65079.1 tripartite tricarboxylate transporter substrate binding protein [Variovorax sp. PAMC26660]
MFKHFNRNQPPPISALLALSAFCALAAPATAQTTWHPDRPVTLVVPYAAGGGTDATARAVSKQLGVIWGQPVIVENMPGADGLIGTRRVMEARPDGYTLLLQVPSIVVTRYTPGLKGIDPLARLEPVTAVSQSPAAVVVSAKLPVKTFGEFVQYCKAAAQPCSLGTGESLARISAKQLAAEAGLPNLIVVNYRGTGAIVTDMIANNVNMAFTGITAALPHYKAGTLKILATQGPKRAAALPEVPTTAEAGYPQFQSVTWFGLFAPKGTPASVTQGIVAGLREAVKDADVRKTIASAGAEPVVNTPAAFAAQVREESERMAALVKLYPLE